MDDAGATKLSGTHSDGLVCAAEQESAASTAELAVLDAKAKQDAAHIQQLWEEEDRAGRRAGRRR
jgi:hypothetical protein